MFLEPRKVVIHVTPSKATYRFYGGTDTASPVLLYDPSVVVFDRHRPFPGQMKSIGRADRWARVFFRKLGLDKVTTVAAGMQLLEKMTNACQHAVPDSPVQVSLIAIRSENRWTVSSFATNSVTEVDEGAFVITDQLMDLTEHLDALRGRGWP